MAWDASRPYAPFSKHRMESYAAYTPDERDIDLIWNGDGTGVACAGLTRGNGRKGPEFRPFKDVELTLAYDGYDRGRSAITFRWRDENDMSYPMFANELDSLLRRGLLKRRMHALWSAEKRGANYGVTLVRPLDD